MVNMKEMPLVIFADGTERGRLVVSAKFLIDGMGKREV